ncbi:MAG: nicotinate (nicotinamide) nucleotide adenylyltransferase [Prevotella sp.]|nr:nicotinate (nicotinamide) nucleotide adenylyltransferase [Bacteroides sp.]MCM1366174.1 nicotinate (nicotinamide) nucleotide adenylyltransferase [Prevotella sp.]MCM1436761.1 nicotinate (nicotinamide) nucleotide adenylyltransferase [Prevotella sp.]
MKRIAIYGGTFDPIHNGHLMLANYVAQSGLVDEVRLMVSPLNPFKTGVQISTDRIRLEMARTACRNLDNVSVSDFEMTLPQPNYTAHTLEALSEHYPEDEFSLLIGADNLLVFDKWCEPEKILQNHRLIVYPRPGYNTDADIPTSILENSRHGIILLNDAPVAEISSSFIRSRLALGKDMRGFIPECVQHIINSDTGQIFYSPFSNGIKHSPIEIIQTDSQ